MFRHSRIFGGEGKDLIHRLEKLLGVGIGHLYFGGRVFAEFPRDIPKALRLDGDGALARTRDRGISLLAEGREKKSEEADCEEQGCDEQGSPPQAHKTPPQRRESTTLDSL